MSQPLHPPRLRGPGALAFGLLLLLALGACDNDTSIRFPSAPTGPLIVDSFSTSTQPEPDGRRIQVRARVTSGLDRLSQAARSGAAEARVCLSGSCVRGPLTTVFSEALCAAVPKVPIGGAGLGLGAAWLDADTVGVDFCVQNPTGQETYEITVMDGVNESNTIRTSCAANGACGSG